MNQEAAWTTTVYQELRRMADALMVGERHGHTLEPTALTHELWLKLLESRNASELDHGAFLGLAAQSMRRILNDSARRRQAAKRGGGQHRTTLKDRLAAPEPQAFALDLDAALNTLAELDPQLARLVELRFYAGLDVDELSAALDLSPRTVKRRWRFARAWLRRQLPEELP